MEKFSSYTKHLEEKKKKLSDAIIKLEEQQKIIGNISILSSYC